MFDYLTDFGFDTSSANIQSQQQYEDVKFGPQRDNIKAIWTTLIYILLTLGLFARPLVTSFTNVASGLNKSNLRWEVLITALIVALAMLSPVLRAISKVHRGKLSWQHCLTAFSIGFFSDLTFSLILDQFKVWFK